MVIDAIPIPLSNIFDGGLNDLPIQSLIKLKYYINAAQKEQLQLLQASGAPLADILNSPRCDDLLNVAEIIIAEGLEDILQAFKFGITQELLTELYDEYDGTNNTEDEEKSKLHDILNLSFRTVRRLGGYVEINKKYDAAIESLNGDGPFDSDGVWRSDEILALMGSDSD